MSEGEIQQIGTPTDIYNEPANAFVADFIGESNILCGTMVHDCLVNVAGTELPCVDKGFGCNQEVDVVIRPEDIEISTDTTHAQFVGKITFPSSREYTTRCWQKPRRATNSSSRTTSISK